MNVVVKHISDNGKNITANTEKGKKSTIRLIIARLMISAMKFRFTQRKTRKTAFLRIEPIERFSATISR